MSFHATTATPKQSIKPTARCVELFSSNYRYLAFECLGVKANPIANSLRMQVPGRVDDDDPFVAAQE
jgi:hypothetical protein